MGILSTRALANFFWLKIYRRFVRNLNQQIIEGAQLDGLPVDDECLSGNGACPNDIAHRHAIVIDDEQLVGNNNRCYFICQIYLRGQVLAVELMRGI